MNLKAVFNVNTTVTLRQMPILLLSAWAALFCASPARALTSSDAEYLQHIATALTEMRAGSYESASQALAAAEEHRRDERMAYLARAVALLQAGAYPDARTAIEDARSMGAEKELCDYASSMERLASRDYAGALAMLPTSGKWATSGEIRAARAYIQLMSGSGANTDALGKDDIRALAMLAYSSLRKQSDAEATALLAQIKPADDMSWTLDRGVVMSMDPNAPLLAMTTTARTASLSGKGKAGVGGTFSGTVTLKADRSKTPNADYLLFYVDETLIGIVNTFPFEAHWNTTRFANGVHTVRIRGETRDGVSAGETSTKVIVYNAAPEPGPPLQGPEVDRLLDAIWDALNLRPSATWAEYQKARMAEAAGNADKAMLGYEKILAFQPLYRDVQERWKALAGARNSAPLWKGSGSGSAVAITFDDGPNEGTQQLLATLKEIGLKATFFIVGSQARRDPEAIRQMVSAGHEIACHSETHRSLTQMDEPELIRELFGPISVVHEITGRSPRYFRPPGGHFGAAERRVSSSFGLTPVMWTNHCGPYEGGQPLQMEQYMASNCAPGSIVLMHNCEPTTLRALPGIAAALARKGLSPVTISQLAAR